MHRLLSAFSEKHLRYLIAVHFVIGVAYHLFIAPPPNTAEDYDIAQHLVRGEGFSIYDRGPTSVKGPFYPTLLAFFLWLFGDPQGLLPVVLLQQALCSFHIGLLYYMGRVLYDDETLAKGAAILFALHPSYVYSAGVIENTLWATAVAIGWSIVLFRKSAYTWKETIILGVVSGSMFVEKPAMGLLMMAVALYRMHRSFYGMARYFSGWLIVPLLWSIRGWLVLGEVSPTKNYAAFISLCQSWTQEFSISHRYTISPAYDRMVDSLFRRPESESLPILRQLAIQTILERPGLYIERTLVHALIYWTIPPRYHGNYSLKFVFVRLLPVGLLLVLTIWGAYRIWGHRQDIVVGIGIVLMYYTLFYSLIHVLNIRFKLEIEWLQLYLCAGVFLPETQVKANKARERGV